MATDADRTRQPVAAWAQSTAAALDAIAAAVVHVAPDGALLLACSCGEPIPTLQRLNSHMGLHASAAAQGVPWDVVMGRRAHLERTRAVPSRDDDYGQAAGQL